ncbi:MAG TPA: CHAT domain-containing protein [Pseudonocardiaceae bacterium]|nr:CHAT domain-containing protein [Pseudonocardiaceae bacterium]
MGIRDYPNGVMVVRTLLVEYLLLPEGVIVFGVRRDWNQPAVARFPMNMSDLALFVESNFGSGKQVRDFVELGMEPAWHLYDRLIAPVKEWCEPGDVVYLIPHGVLHYVPIHAWRVDGRPLVERNPIVYSPSASVLGSIRSRRTRLSAPEVAVLGDSLGDLPYSRAEATQIADLLGTKPLLGSDATRPALLEGLSTADVVHIAGHGHFVNDDPLASGVFLAERDNLSAADVFRLPPVKASLITLSGCETGVSRNRPGDELVGLTRAFLYARASALVVSLWSVADQSTAFLMGRFYSHLFSDRTVSTAHALQAAMVDTMSRPEWSSLYHWAPFVLTGDWH